MAAEQKATQVKISDITIIPEIQIRLKINESHVAEIAEAVDSDTAIDPVDLFRDAEKRLILGDGAHRVLAFTQCNKDKIPAIIHDDNPDTALSDALEFSLRRNCKHGLRMTTGDKAKAVKAALSDKVLRRKSDRSLADICGVSPALVKKIRSLGDDPIPPPNKKKTTVKKHERALPDSTSGEEDPIEDRIKTMRSWMEEGHLDWGMIVGLFKTDTHLPALLPVKGTLGIKVGGKKRTMTYTSVSWAKKGDERIIQFEGSPDAEPSADAGANAQ